MEAEFSRDLVDPNQPILDAMAERPGKPVKLRIQPMILYGRQYNAWKDVRWTLEFESPDEVFATRDAMRAFFTALVKKGPLVVTRLLTDDANTNEEERDETVQHNPGLDGSEAVGGSLR
jgi:hypothetical protein